ncbi:MAG: Elongation factor G [Candidatus Saccharibacteria bacterium GW2011_GWA2_46_10]|nr:MAG: Elongation factor G [Candidatus Saccharibacteria bacterium GW2011_GWA2_46_10]OGL36172.1 MAG: translation elongation factor G [Candidatus Saccharibacteria bacterium RIFCSPHIGHO2_12_FULL_47_17]
MADKKYPLTDLRNIGIIAHIDAGKTTTTEAILYRTGLKHKIGEVHAGDTTTDWMAQEKERGITITAAAVTCIWGDKKINIIDTPGHIDFTVEVERSLRVLDGAVVVFDGKMGVESQSETVWRQADRYNVPRFCFINKINQTGGDFYKSLESIHHRLSKRAFPIHLPIGFEQNVKGVVDLISMKAYTYKEYHDKNLIEGEIPADMTDQVKKYRSLLVENAVAEDEQMLEKYLEVGEEGLSEDEIRKAIRTAVLTGKFFAVTGGDGRGVIVERLLDAVTDFLPSPLDRGSTWGTNPKNGDEVERKPDASEPFAALAFKIATDPFVGKLAFFRVYSGKIVAGSYILNSSTGEKERVGRVVRLHADKREDVSEIEAGDIAAIVGLKGTTTGNTLCDPMHPIVLESITFPDPPVSIAIEPKTKADQEKMSQALQRLAEEDPTFRMKINHETGQTIISGMGELHLEIIADRMKREFTVDANVGEPQVAYRETIRKDGVEAEGKYIRQTGGRGQYGHCWLRIFQNEAGKGFEFINSIKGGAIPSEFIPAIKSGIEEAMANGVIAGYPVVDVKVELYDGSYHDVDSSEVAFKIAGSAALQDAVKKAAPVLLEPIMKIVVVTPEGFMGDVIGDLNSKRGRIESMIDLSPGIKEITAFAPLGEMFGYVTNLRSMTQGRASSSMELDHYADVPSNVAAGIIAKTGK